MGRKAFLEFFQERAAANAVCRGKHSFSERGCCVDVNSDFGREDVILACKGGIHV